MPSTNTKILIIEETQELVEVLKRLLRSLDYRVKVNTNILELQEILTDGGFDVIFCDIRFWLSAQPVFDVLEAARKKHIPVIMLADYAEFGMVNDCLKAGACSWLSKPLKTEQTLRALDEALSMIPMLEQNAPEPEEIEIAEEPQSEIQKHFGILVGEHDSMKEVYRQLERVAQTDISVLINGESGTGKELIARSVHAASNRAGQPFIAINCSSMPANLLESELFGHVKGAFTGAVKNKDGLFLAANGGTLFLDEVGSIPINMQLVLLRTLQQHEIRPVGGIENISVDVRIIAASNENLTEKMENGLLRSDLYYRLCGFSLELPPLRERKSDIPLLVKYFLDKIGRQNDCEIQVSSEAAQILYDYDWPGNVRELQNVILRASALTDNNLILAKDLPVEMLRKNSDREEHFPEGGDLGAGSLFPSCPAAGNYSLKAYLKICERHYVKQVLKNFNGDKEAAAKSLGISMATFYRKFEE